MKPINVAFPAAEPDFTIPDLASFDFDALPTASSATLPAGQALGVQAQRITRHPRQRRFVDMREQVDAARKLVCPLPRPGESVHALLSGEFILAAVIPAILDELAQPAALTVSTLGLNDVTVDLMVRELETGRLTKCDLVLSHYFQQADKEQCARAVHRMHQAGQAVSVCRNHAKLMLFQPAKGRDRYVIETSANLRSAVCLEQLTLSNDAALFGFHTGWLRQILASSPVTP
jgi:hypothetical protein